MFVVHLGRVELGHEANSSLGAKWPRNVTYQPQRSGPSLAPVAFLAISVYDIREREAISPRSLLLSCSPPFLRSLPLLLRNVPPQVIRCPLFPRYINMYFR